MARTKPRPSRASHAKLVVGTESRKIPDPREVLTQSSSKRKRPVTEEDEGRDANRHGREHADTPLPPAQTSTPTRQNRLLPLNSPLRIPSNLQPVYRALGPQNWAEYLRLMLLFCRREIDADEFVQRGERIFKVDDKVARKRILRLVMSEMVVPFMKEEKEKEEKEKEEKEKEEKEKEEKEKEKIEEARRGQKRIRLGGEEE